ncbi:uncharacterized protein LOC128882653 [Hylaeus volcanicus]|uniref:uncharacterized protein LOC128882653 n=1 Tax=Hylaeus volcanicus TaxID=313075 RepID=UPI0023B7A5E7|nr:uncharacterized protein LOC128882653 [Hylaeus volcanicus]
MKNKSAISDNHLHFQMACLNTFFAYVPRELIRIEIEKIMKLKQVTIHASSVLPFSRPIFVGLTEDKNVFIFGNDKTLTPFSNVLNLLKIHENFFITNSYQPSRLISKRHDGVQDTATFLNFENSNGPMLLKTIVSKENPLSRLPTDALECRVVEHCIRYSDPEMLKAKADAYIKTITLKEGHKKKGETIKDVDGFVHISRSQTPGILNSLCTNNFGKLPSSTSRFVTSTFPSSTQQNKSKKRKGGQEADFYRFQIRQQKEEEYHKLKEEKEMDLVFLQELRKKKKLKF